MSSSLPFSDRPLRLGETDLLDRGPFIANLAEVISNAPKGESIVFALYGKWGEGKTSVLALLEEEFGTRKKNGTATPVVIKFNPWVFSGREHLFQAFFEDIGNSIGSSGINDAEEKAKRWKRLGAYSNLIGGGLNHVDTVLNVFGASIPGWKLLGKFLGNVGEIAEQAATAEDASPEQNLSVIRKELEDELEKSECPFLVVLDDLDRLPPRELVEIFQLLKSTVDLPNVHYLLLCDRKNIEHNLEQQGLRADYLEKIVQFSAPLPPVPVARLHSLLIEELEEIFSERAPEDTRFTQDFWSSMAESALPGPFSNLRDVKRYLGELRLALPVFCRNGFFELNPQQFLQLQALRLFCPKAVDLIREHRDLFVFNVRGLLLEEERKRIADLQKSFIEKTLPKALDDWTAQEFELLTRQLLLPAGIDLSDREIASEERHLTSRMWFDTYFTLELPQRSVTVEEASLIRSSLGTSQSQISEAILPIVKRTGFGALVRCLETQFRNEVRIHGQALLTAMLSTSSDLSDGDSESGFPSSAIFDYFNHWLHEIPRNEREEKTINLLQSSKNHLFFSMQLDEIESDVESKGGLKRLLGGFEGHLGKETARIIREKAERKESLLEDGFYYAHDVWEKWGPKGALKKWIRLVTKNDEGFKDYLRALGGYRTSHYESGREKESFWLSFHRLRSYPSLQEGIKRCQMLRGSSKDKRERLLLDTAIEKFQSAAEYRKGERLIRKKFPDLVKAKFYPYAKLTLKNEAMAIVTASNPRGIQLPKAENQKRAPDFQQALRDMGIHRGMLRVGCNDSNTSWPCCLIEANEERAMEISKEHGQATVFMIYGGKRVVLLGCNGEGKLELGKLQDLVIVKKP